jgi:tRNA-guanine family transglycosylase
MQNDNAKCKKNLQQGGLVKITEKGLEFTSHLDGSKHFFTPEKSIQIQKQLGADIISAFDECTSPLAGYTYTKRAMERTHRWAKRCLKEFKESQNSKVKIHQSIFGIVQGGEYRDLREESAKFIASLLFLVLALEVLWESQKKRCSKF